jgi:predicted cupin superfamily sugar epimerase
MKIKNSFWFRHFLMCSKVANLMMSARGWYVDNFAQSIIESQNGRYGNDQMNIYFTMADMFFSELHCSEEDEVFNYLEENGITMEDLAKLSAEEIEEYYDKYCIGNIDFSNIKID